MAAIEPETLITGEVAKLPPEVRPYFDPQQPLPASVQFFEERKTASDLARTIALGIGLIAVGLALLLLGILLIVLSVIGIIFLVAGGWILYTARTRRDSMKAQQAGEHTRYGIFLFGDTFAQNNEFGYTLIPRSKFLGIVNGQVDYMVHGEEKFFDLPKEIVGADIKTMLAAIEAWRGKQ